MRSIQLFCFILWALAIASCNQKPADQKAEPAPTTEQPNAAEPSTTKASEGHDYTFLTTKMLEYKAALVPGVDPKEQPFAGQWIKMDPDGSYKTGKYDKMTHTGKWAYNHEARVLLLQPDNKEIKHSEWKVLFNDDMIVFVGTPSFGDNGTQIQLVRIDKYPEKK